MGEDQPVQIGRCLGGIGGIEHAAFIEAFDDDGQLVDGALGAEFEERLGELGELLRFSDVDGRGADDEDRLACDVK